MKITVVEGKQKISSTNPMYLPAVEVPRKIWMIGIDTRITCNWRMMSVKIQLDSVNDASTSFVFHAMTHVSTVGMAMTSASKIT